MTGACEPGTTMQAFADAKLQELLSVAVTAIQRAAKSPDEEAVHKMRVSIRRLQQGLRLFREFLRKKGVKNVRAELKSIMEPAGELRNYDIALGLLRRSAGNAPEIRARHLAARRVLQDAVQKVAEPDLQARWTAELGVKANETVEA